MIVHSLVVPESMGITAAAAARVLMIPASRIRKWTYRGLIHRYPDGTLDPGCVAARALIGLEDRQLAELFHDDRCHVLGMIK